ncbi:hypothetical protein DYB32_000242 [Aphanomyces invadans]|uniref:VPS9 domain-containing protein n=1 Tax=Aphanomyces invadans TaxID=157072 RepID=A0A3R6ZXP5_9STRA|nr:hypothetical protein DYB32_000242 [Aphanomyces invadans]
MVPNWSEHPVNENFYGKAGAPTATDSPYDAVFSPMSKHKGMYGARDVYTTEIDRLRSTNNNDQHEVDTLKTRASTGFKKAVVERPAGPPLESYMDEIDATMEHKVHHFGAVMAAAAAMDERMNQSKPEPESLPEFVDLFLKSLTADATKRHADGLPRLYGMVARAAHHRCMNQLHRHRRYLESLHHILTGAQVTDVGLTSKEVASVTSVDDVLVFDVKLHYLSRQRDWLLQLQLAREQAMAHAPSPSSNNHLHSAAPRSLSKHAHMKKLLEVAGWYRWLQQHADEDNNDAVGDDVDERHEHLAEVLSDDAILSVHVDLMATDEWRSVIQAQFENLVFGHLERRISQRVDKGCFDAAALYCESFDPSSNQTSGKRSKASDYLNVHPDWTWLRDPQPKHVMAFVTRMTRHIRRTFAISDDMHKSLYVFIQRMLFPRMTMLCFNGAVLTECARKDALWRSQQIALRRQHHGKGVSLEQLGVSVRTAVVLHQEAAQIFGTTRIPVDTFFPLFSYVLLHTDLPFVHAQLHLLEQYALCNPPGDLNPTRSGEESYYVYCMHAAVEHICSQVVAPLEHSRGAKSASPSKMSEKPKQKGKGGSLSKRASAHGTKSRGNRTLPFPEEVLPLIYPFLTWRDTYRVRGVSRSWQTAYRASLEHASLVWTSQVFQGESWDEILGKLQAHERVFETPTLPHLAWVIASGQPHSFRRMSGWQKLLDVVTQRNLLPVTCNVVCAYSDAGLIGYNTNGGVPPTELESDTIDGNMALAITVGHLPGTSLTLALPEKDEINAILRAVQAGAGTSASLGLPRDTSSVVVLSTNGRQSANLLRGLHFLHPSLESVVGALVHFTDRCVPLVYRNATYNPTNRTWQNHLVQTTNLLVGFSGRVRAAPFVSLGFEVCSPILQVLVEYPELFT